MECTEGDIMYTNKEERNATEVQTKCYGISIDAKYSFLWKKWRVLWGNYWFKHKSIENVGVSKFPVEQSRASNCKNRLRTVIGPRDRSFRFMDRVGERVVTHQAREVGGRQVIEGLALHTKKVEIYSTANWRSSKTLVGSDISTCKLYSSLSFHTWTSIFIK